MRSILIKLLTLQQRGKMNTHELFYLIFVILMFFFYLKHRDTDVDLSAFKHFSGLKKITLYSRFSSQTTDSLDLNMIFSYNN